MYTAEVIEISLDGTAYCALLGSNLQEGTAGFGSTLPEALEDLASQLREEGREILGSST